MNDDKQTDGGTGNAWTDTVVVNDVDGGPSAELGGEGSWTLSTDDAYTMTDDGIEFTDDNASGTITYWDGSEIDFSNIETINWNYG